jgi:phosphoribosylformimino-5-aminoimidazole carboxamide ribotide isomerase
LFSQISNYSKDIYAKTVSELVMKIIPVMDLLDEKVVHGIAGKRKEYQPIKDSVVTNSVDPLIVARDFNEKLGLDWIYIADLNMIQKTENAHINKNKIIEITHETELNVMMDGGCTNKNDVEKILDLGIKRVIIGTETLESLNELEDIANMFDSEKIILSVDFKEGKLLTKNNEINKLKISDFIDFVDSFSLYAIIVLELQKVGSQSGPLNNSLFEIMKTKPTTQVFAGGGVRDVQDLIDLQQNSISGALVATAFHKGLIKKEDLKLLD